MDNTEELVQKADEQFKTGNNLDDNEREAVDYL